MELQRFNPYRKSPTGFWTPDYIALAEDLSIGAQRTYAVLGRYAGKNGECFPSEKTLSKDLRVSERQARRYVSELVKNGYIESNRAHRHQSNRYYFLYKEEFAKFGIQPDLSSLKGRECPVPERTPEDAKEVQSEVVQLRGSTDSDLHPAIRTNRDSQAAVPYAALADTILGILKKPVSAETLATIVSKTPDQSEAQALTAIRAVCITRGYNSEHEHGPWSGKWFITVVMDFWKEFTTRTTPMPARCAENSDVDTSAIPLVPDFLDVDTSTWGVAA